MVEAPVTTLIATTSNPFTMMVLESGHLILFLTCNVENNDPRAILHR